MSEVSMAFITIGELRNVCDTQRSCNECPFKCGLDKLAIQQLCKKTIDTDMVRYPIRIGDIVDSDYWYQCDLYNGDCSQCELTIFITIGDCEFPVCINDLCYILSGDYLNHFKDGIIYLSNKHIKKTIMEGLLNGEETKQSD